MKVFFSILSLLVTLILSGCLFGNGEGYGNRPTGSNGDQSPSPNAVGENYYYWIDPAYTCLKEGREIRSFRKAIFVTGTKAFALGDLCKIQVEEIPWNEIKTTYNKLYLQHKEGLYSWLPGVLNENNVTQFSSLEAICFSSAPRNLKDLVIEKSPSPNGVLSAHAYFTKPQLVGDLLRTDESGKRIYSQTNFLLEIELTESGTGKVEMQMESIPIEEALACSVIP